MSDVAKVRDRGLTDQQAAFVTHFTGTEGCIGNGAASARMAGYSEASARDIAAQLLGKPHVRAAVEQANRDRLSGPAATKAAAFLERVVDDEAAPLKVRVEAAKTILDRAGLMPPSVVERAAAVERENRGAKPLADMSLSELGREMARQKAAVEMLRGLLDRPSRHAGGRVLDAVVEDLAPMPAAH